MDRLGLFPQVLRRNENYEFNGLDRVVCGISAVLVLAGVVFADRCP
jgi:hypothetical protein